MRWHSVTARGRCSPSPFLIHVGARSALLREEHKQGADLSGEKTDCVPSPMHLNLQNSGTGQNGSWVQGSAAAKAMTLGLQQVLAAKQIPAPQNGAQGGRGSGHLQESQPCHPTRIPVTAPSTRQTTYPTRL